MVKRNAQAAVGVFILGFFLTLSFQNCSPVQFSSSHDSSVQGQPIFGPAISAQSPRCGSATQAAVPIVPTQDLCTEGSSTEVQTLATHYAWTCPGKNGGPDVDCTSPRIVDGFCGSANNGPPVSASPFANLCLDGSLPNVTAGGAAYSWTCVGANGGTIAPCSEPRVFKAPSGSFSPPVLCYDPTAYGQQTVCGPLSSNQRFSGICQGPSTAPYMPAGYATDNASPSGVPVSRGEWDSILNGGQAFTLSQCQQFCGKNGATGCGYFASPTANPSRTICTPTYAGSEYTNLIVYSAPTDANYNLPLQSNFLPGEDATNSTLYVGNCH